MITAFPSSQLAGLNRSILGMVATPAGHPSGIPTRRCLHNGRTVRVRSCCFCAGDEAVVEVEGVGPRFGRKI